MTTKKTILDQICSTAEAAALLDLSERRVSQLCAAGDLHAKSLGRDWAITTESVRRYGSMPRKRGPKPKGG